MTWSDRFLAYVAKKEQAAATATIPGYHTLETHGTERGLGAIGNAWTAARFDGPFFESASADPALPAINTVFVQSADGNTGSDNPPDLGGGETDKHLIYEGLSGVHADAIISGATTVRGTDMVMATWHPELVRLRSSLGLPRYPVQVVATRHGRLGIESELMFNVPELRVFILTTDQGARTLAPSVKIRPWITVITTGAASDLIAGLRILRADHGIRRVSSIGGRTLATTLIDARVIQDIYLTTSPKPGGEPHTPFYMGARPLDTTLVVRKAGRDGEAGVVFEHLTMI